MMELLHRSRASSSDDAALLFDGATRVVQPRASVARGSRVNVAGTNVRPPFSPLSNQRTSGTISGTSTDDDERLSGEHHMLSTKQQPQQASTRGSTLGTPPLSLSPPPAGRRSRNRSLSRLHLNSGRSSLPTSGMIKVVPESEADSLTLTDMDASTAPDPPPCQDQQGRQVEERLA